MSGWHTPHDDPQERRIWYEDLWSAVCSLRERYRLPIRSRWWEDAIQLEALNALATWVMMYDYGDWDDPPGKLTLLYDLERVAQLLRSGQDPFDPERDRPLFERWLEEQIGEEPSDVARGDQPGWATGRDGGSRR